MKKIFLTASTILVFTLLVNAQLYSTSTAKINFFSKTPVEDISATSVKALSVLNAQSHELAFSVANTSFAFPNKLMEEHFNEKYMESEKYANSTFKGKINEELDLSKEGVYKVTVTGKLNIHGVEKDRTISGTVTISKEIIILQSEFKVSNVDHNITIPKLVGAKIAEEISVMIDANLGLKK
jgi:hypothetical protein